MLALLLLSEARFSNYIRSLILSGLLSSLLILPLAQNGNMAKASASLPKIKDGNYLLALVTKETYLGRYAPGDLVRIPAYLSSREMSLRKEANEHLIKMYNAARLDGVTLTAVSAYRSYDYQKQLFESNVRRFGEKEANRSSARPGQSEHQLGTTVDFGGTGADWTSRFANTAAGRWLRDNAYRYGFVMSYPPNSEHITGYVYEPWHFRYIGIDSAGEWKKSGLVLSEFLKTNPQYYSNYPDNIPVTSVELNKQSVTIPPGRKITLIATIKPADATNKKVTWISSNDAVAKVNSSGEVKGMGEGEATITAVTDDGNKKAVCLVTVEYIEVTGVTISEKELVLATREVFTLTAVIAPDNATNKDVTWESDNPDIASVNANGVVTVKDVGEAVITVTTVCGNKQDACFINVPYVAPENISLNHDEYTLYLSGIRNRVQLKEIIEPANTSYIDIIWHTGEGNIAAVENGLVTAAGSGTTVITAEMVDPEITAVCHITVIDDGIMYGDVNGDKEVNVQDAIMILRHVVGLVSLTDACKQAADVTGSGDIAVQDAIKILRYVVGLY